MEAGRAFLRDDRDHASTATALPWARDERGIGPLLGWVGEDVEGAARRGATSTPRFRGGGYHSPWLRARMRRVRRSASS
ncbi:MAG: hypothetical protein JO329_02460, partial [Planctomycetaceae bacterium]|nr:hypothetical protein [Planctomycetaceae bacterium]